MSLQDLRSEYTRDTLSEENAPADPLALFSAWLTQAQEAKITDANAMTLATADAQGQPSARVVLLKGVEDGHFVFFSNYTSRKGRELDTNPRACLSFFWPTLERQVRIDGTVAPISPVASDAYFASRPRASRLGAWTSPQSEVINNRDVLEQRFTEYEQRFAGTEPPRPNYWGGYALTPSAIEFWQGRASRLHDRLRYMKAGKHWVMTRLAP